MGVVFKVTYPNGKIFVGKDLTNTLTYVGSVQAALVAADFTDEQRRGFTIRKEILMESDSVAEVNRAERELIRELRANDPAGGYKRSPRPAHRPGDAGVTRTGQIAAAAGARLR